MTVDKNQAVMSGTITEASIKDLVGQRVLLTVEDNGDGSGDKVTWGVYKPGDKSWTPTDAELKEDDGAKLKWTATDAEIKDDAGIPMPKDDSINAQSFPVSSYAFIETERGAGDIKVTP